MKFEDIVARYWDYLVFEFRWTASRYAGAAPENVAKIGQKITFLKKWYSGTTVKSFYIALKWSPRVPD